MKATIKIYGKETEVETVKVGKTEYYKGYSLSFDKNKNKWVARYNRKTTGCTGATKIDLIASVEMYRRNKEFSKTF